jgi:Zn-dependent protease with chaperone function
MRAETRQSTLGIAAAFSLLVILPVPALADQHGVESIVAALKSPISSEAITEAREFDDKVMSGGEAEGVRVYLVTDERSTRVNGLVTNLLHSIGEDPAGWTVRVLDTDPPLINAFVAGGKYIYVYTGLVAQNPSEDELAFILSHELGHSFLKHQERQAKDGSSTWAGLAGLAALFSEKNRDTYSTLATAITSSYSRGDEEEADAMGCTIAYRAGYDPLRGVDFFTRSQRDRDRNDSENNQALAQSKTDYEHVQANCLQLTTTFKSSTDYQTQANADRVNAVCQDAEARRLHHNEIVEQYNAALAEERRNVLLSDHPQDQSRIGAIAAVSDYLAGRRDRASLAKYKQTSRVVDALEQERPELLKTSDAKPPTLAPAPGPIPSASLEDQLKQLQGALDHGLISKEEYERKRQEILARF